MKDTKKNNDLKTSIVIPVYRSSESIAILLESLHQVLTSMSYDYEIILVDDCSPDNTWKILKSLKKKYNDTIKIARLLKNSGQHNALLCGLYLSSGDIVVTMDDDLQNPPEEIPKLVAAIEQGFDLAIGAYDSKKHAKIRQPSSQLIDWILKTIFALPSNFQLTSFRATTRIVVDNVCRMSGVFPYITAMLLSHATRYVNVPVRHDARRFGHSNYTLRRSLRLAANLIFSYSPYPLYCVAILCGLAFICSFIFSIIIIYFAFIYGTSVPGWASTIVIVAFFNAITLLCLVIFGIYLSRISQQITRTRLSYTISELHE